MPLLRGTRYPLLGNTGGFLPSKLEGLVMWTRYGSGITITGSGVSQWDDVSGNGNHLLQGTDAFRPSKEADGSILFDGTDHRMSASFTLIQPETVYILGKHITWTSGDRWFDGAGANSGTGYMIGVSGDVKLYAGNFQTNPTNIPLDTYGVMTGVINGASSALQWENETPETAGDIGVNNMGGFTLASKAAGTGEGNIQVKEVLVFNTAHDAATRAQVIAYLQTI